MTSDKNLAAWTGAFTDAFHGKQFAALTFDRPQAGAGDLKSIGVREILIKGERKLSFTYRYKTRDVVKNFEFAAGFTRICDEILPQFSRGRLCTLQTDLLLARDGESYKMTMAPASHKALPDPSHNRKKQHPIKSQTAGYLHRLGLTDAEGQVLKTARDKFRQINKYIEILDGLVQQLHVKGPLRITDMGAGKGYLTFALYDHLVNHLKLEVVVTGVEQRQELVELCNGIARAEGFENLQFVQGSIAGHDCNGADAVIALHACDTATDDAIAKAVRAEVALIVVAPCCHKQIRREMEGNPASTDLEILLRHGTYADRLAEMLTDGLRAELLELYCYKSKLFEFISDAHTPRNVMIVGMRRSRPWQPDKALQLRQSIAATKAKFGIAQHRLESLLDG